MPTSLRLLGVHGRNAPTRKTLSVTPADFAIAGLVGRFERQYAVAMEVNNPSEEIEKFGGFVNSNTYGKDCLKTFWDNLGGTKAKIYVKSHVGNDAGVIDAIVSNLSVNGTGGNPTMKFSCAYKGVADYGVQGDRTARKITNGYRFSTTLLSGADSADTHIHVTALMGIKVGDLIVHIDGSSNAAYHKVTEIDEGINSVTLDTALGQTGLTGEAVKVLGFKIQTYRKSTTGIVTEVETQLGKSWCTLEPEVTEFYVENVHANNRYLKVEDLDSVDPLNTSYPADDSDPTYLASGSDGTTPSTDAHWTFNLSAFDSFPIRMLANCETILVAAQKSVESYCKARDDTPISFGVLQKDLSKSSLISYGAQFQRSNEVFQAIVETWIGITDPYTNSPSAPDREIPNVGAVMGAYMQSINLLGIHYVPCVDSIILNGINSIVDTNLGEATDQDRTDLAEYGINIIQFVKGQGFRIRNLFALSTDSAGMFTNGLMMRNFIKVSAQDSLQSSENYPNSFQRILADRDAISNFLFKLWFKGSTNSVPEGETFGQYIKADGSPSTPSDHFEVQADAVNNPITSIQAGERNLNVGFTFPAPTGSIYIDVGIILK